MSKRDRRQEERFLVFRQQARSSHQVYTRINMLLLVIPPRDNDEDRGSNLERVIRMCRVCLCAGSQLRVYVTLYLLP